jgi:hypothetical protein
LEASTPRGSLLRTIQSDLLLDPLRFLTKWRPSLSKKLHAPANVGKYTRASSSPSVSRCIRGVVAVVSKGEYEAAPSSLHSPLAPPAHFSEHGYDVPSRRHVPGRSGIAAAAARSPRVRPAGRAGLQKDPRQQTCRRWRMQAGTRLVSQRLPCSHGGRPVVLHSISRECNLSCVFDGQEMPPGALAISRGKVLPRQAVLGVWKKAL